MKRLYIILLCAMLATTGQAQQTNLPAEYKIYDLNGDGKFTANDARTIYDYILNSADENITLSTVDLNKDGVANTADVVTLYVALRKYNQSASDNNSGTDPEITNPDMEWGVSKKRDF